MDRKTLGNKIIAVLMFIVGSLSVYLLHEATFSILCYLFGLAIWLIKDN